MPHGEDRLAHLIHQRQSPIHVHLFLIIPRYFPSGRHLHSALPASFLRLPSTREHDICLDSLYPNIHLCLCDSPTTEMNRLFGAKNTAPKPTLNQAIDGVGHLSLHSDHLTDGVLGRRSHRFYRCQTRQNQCRTHYLPTEDVQNAGWSWQTSHQSESPQSTTEEENVRDPTRSAATTVVEYGASRYDAGQPQECHDHRRYHEDYK